MVTNLTFALNQFMNTQELLNYQRVEKAIAFIRQHARQQPSLDEIAAHVHLSPFHFQRLFSDWAGISPKKFLQYTSLEYAKQRLRKQNNLFTTALDAGVSGTGRLHDLFVSMEGMTPGEFKQGGKGLSINYSFSDTLFGTVLCASTARGLCQLQFVENEETGLAVLKHEFPNAEFRVMKDSFQEKALSIFEKNWVNPGEIKLHLKATDFQVKVWQSLLQIPYGNLCSYGEIAESIGNARASRAVGTAVGSNPIACLIPCHRVIQANGNYGQYRWGSARKSILIAMEGLLTDEQSLND